MKKGIFTKIASAALSAGILLSAAGCGGGGLFGGGGNNDYDDDEDVESITVFRNELETVNAARRLNTPIYRAVKEAVGFDIEAVTASTDWETMLNKMWFDQDLPDIFLCKGPDSPEFYRKLIEGGDILAIDDYVNESTKDEYPNLYAVMQRTSYLADNVSYAQGKQWAIPSAWELEKSMYVRQDWIDNLNAKLDKCLVGEGVISSVSEYDAATMYEKYRYTVPETLLEFYRLARAFTLYDPDGNGKNDTFGYESESNLDMDAWIYVAFGAGWHVEMKDGSGKYIASEISDASMYATAFINRLMAEGYMNVNSLTNDNGAKQTDFSRGRTGMIFAHNWLNTFVSDMMDSYHISLAEATAKITMFDPPKGRDGAYGADAGYDNFWQFNCISSHMGKNRIKACLKLFDFMYSDEGRFLFEYGVEGTDFEYVLDESRQRVPDETFPDRDKKTVKRPLDEKGFTKAVGAADSAYQLYSLSWWTGHYNSEYGVNQNIISKRQERSSQYGYKVDYPYIQTEKYMQYISGMRDFAEESFVEIMNDTKGRYWKYYIDSGDYDTAFNWETFSWDDLYILPRNIRSRWNSYVKDFNGTYHGTEVYDEYNAYIQSGQAKKRTADGPIYENCGSFYRE